MTAAVIAALASLIPLVVTADAAEPPMSGEPAPAVAEAPEQLSEDAARSVLDGIYQGDFRTAFVDKRPELFLRHVPDDFVSTMVDGSRLDATAIRQVFPQQFATMARTIEHNVTIEDVDVLSKRSISGVVTLTTLIEHRRPGNGTFLVVTVGTFRDDFVLRNGVWMLRQAVQLRGQTITSPRP
ncbi:MAG: hypothetical protein ACRDSK_03045 [Actinophytocola sp.]|uniref:hypothetical protein n=1 Tax=Actinophytocola sp. TaxID=1872138 RepID=UPI003D6AC64E